MVLGSEKDYLFEIIQRQDLDTEIKLLQIKQADRLNKNLEEMIRLLKNK